MKILIAEDDESIASLYKISFEGRNHHVTVTNNGLECLDAYYKGLNEESKKWNYLRPPFDAVALDYKMPEKDGIEVAREILAIVPRQRIIFISAYSLQTLEESVKTLHQVVELIQKPAEITTIIRRIEDADIWAGLEEINVNIKELKRMNLTHNELVSIFDSLKRIQKNIGL